MTIRKHPHPTRAFPDAHALGTLVMELVRRARLSHATQVDITLKQGGVEGTYNLTVHDNGRDCADRSLIERTLDLLAADEPREVLEQKYSDVFGLLSASKAPETRLTVGGRVLQLSKQAWVGEDKFRIYSSHTGHTGVTVEVGGLDEHAVACLKYYSDGLIPAKIQSPHEWPATLSAEQAAIAQLCTLLVTPALAITVGGVSVPAHHADVTPAYTLHSPYGIVRVYSQEQYCDKGTEAILGKPIGHQQAHVVVDGRAQTVSAHTIGQDFFAAHLVQPWAQLPAYYMTLHASEVSADAESSSLNATSTSQRIRLLPLLREALGGYMHATKCKHNLPAACVATMQELGYKDVLVPPQLYYRTYSERSDTFEEFSPVLLTSGSIDELIDKPLAPDLLPHSSVVLVDDEDLLPYLSALSSNSKHQQPLFVRARKNVTQHKALGIRYELTCITYRMHRVDGTSFEVYCSEDVIHRLGELELTHEQADRVNDIQYGRLDPEQDTYSSITEVLWIKDLHTDTVTPIEYNVLFALFNLEWLRSKDYEFEPEYVAAVGKEMSTEIIDAMTVSMLPTSDDAPIDQCSRGQMDELKAALILWAQDLPDVHIGDLNKALLESMPVVLSEAQEAIVSKLNATTLTLQRYSNSSTDWFIVAVESNE